METAKETKPAQSLELVKQRDPAAPIVQLKNLDDLQKFSEFLAKSGLVPAAYRGKAADIAVCILHGHEIGVSAIQSLQSIAVINGNPGMYGDLPLALVRSSGLLEWIKEDWNEETKTATCKIKRLHDPTVYDGSFSLDDAKRAGLADKDNYRKYPRRQCQFRARSFPLRDAFSDVLKGMRQAEEFEEYVETTAEHVGSEPIGMPSRASTAESKPEPKESNPVKDETDQRTAQSEKPEEQSHDRAAQSDDHATLKTEIKNWIETASDDEIVKSASTDKLFSMMAPLSDDDEDKKKLTKQYIDRKQAIWKARRAKQQ